MIFQQLDPSMESLECSMTHVVRIYHPNLRAQIASLKQSFARLVLKKIPLQPKWLSIYKLFSEFATSLESHMFHEEICFFHELGVGSEKNGGPSGSSVSAHLPQLEEEHHLILREWKALEESVRNCAGAGPEDELAGEARFELANLEMAIIEHERFETIMIYRRFKESGDEK
jgi:iron-sulfur cluster repair protein YtfE (RIC family)